jgi:GT2 family glycosyltransferase
MIDNASGPETAGYLKDFASSHSNVRLIVNERNVGWVKAVNQGMAAAKSPYVCIMNNDTVVKTQAWLARMIDVAAAEPDIGLVNPRFEVRKKGVCRGHFVETDFCRGYCVLIKKEVIDRIGLFDEAYGMGYCDDHDYSVRAIRAGYRCVMACDVVVEHLRNSTFTALLGTEKLTELNMRNSALFESKWGRKLRLLFLLKETDDLSKVGDMLLALARRQHKVRVWNAGRPLSIRHTNVIERNIFPPFSRYVFSAALRMNGSENRRKRYDAVFLIDRAADTEKIMSEAERLSRV